MERVLKRGLESGRTDDNVKSMEKRLHTFENETMKIIEHFQDTGKVKKV